MVLSCCKKVPRHNWSPGPSTANCVAVDGPPGPTIAAMDGPLCRKWSPGRKPAHGGDKSWLATPFNNSTMHAWAFVAIAGRE